ncbi:MAG: hypothetical protein OSB00_13230 [Sphingomonas bacterium]|nr:hypothetical protein [Sphingomonas bacterium]
MGVQGARADWQSGTWAFVTRLGGTDGSEPHPFSAALAGGRANARDLSDAVHAICAVHGQLPGLADEALVRCVQPDAAAWLEAIAEGFASERAYLALLAAAVGPVPSTPAQAQTETALIGARHAIEMLAKSERVGCATGAIAALVADWPAIRRVLDRAADRFGVDAPASAMPIESETATSMAMLGATPAIERAISFGAQQLYAQHRGLFDLLESRSSARAD